VISDRHSLPSQRLFGCYMYFVLENSLTSLVGPAPQRADLAEVARRIEPRFMRLLPDGANELHPVLLTPFDLATEEEKVTGSRYTLCALVAVGALLEDGERELERAKPLLDARCARGAATIRRICEAPPNPAERMCCQVERELDRILVSRMHRGDAATPSSSPAAGRTGRSRAGCQFRRLPRPPRRIQSATMILRGHQLRRKARPSNT
jgi:hypothetical protein